MAEQPRYQQLKAHIIDGIENGHWGVDSMVPSENILAQEFCVSRMTANRALKELTEEGVLYRIQGLGTYVAERKPTLSMLHIRNIADEIRERGHRHECDLLNLEKVTADMNIAHRLELPVGAETFHSVIVHKENGTPIQYEERYVNPLKALEYLQQDFNTITPNEYLCNVAPLTEAEHIIEAIIPDEEIIKILKLDNSEPCLLVSRRTWSKNILVCYARLIHPGSRYRIGGRLNFY